VDPDVDINDDNLANATNTQPARFHCRFGCDLVFDTEIHLTSHHVKKLCAKKVELAISNGITICQHCDLAVSGANSCRYKRRHHAADLYNTASRWKCHACGLGFSREKGLWWHLSTVGKHIRSHTIADLFSVSFGIRNLLKLKHITVLRRLCSRRSHGPTTQDRFGIEKFIQGLGKAHGITDLRCTCD